MRRIFFILGLAGLVLGVPVPAGADSLAGLVTSYAENCPRVESAVLIVKFQSIEKGARQAVTVMEARVAEIERTLKGAKDGDYTIENRQLSIQAVDQREAVVLGDAAEGYWKVAGEVALQMASREEAQKAFIALSTAGFIPSLSIQFKPQKNCRR